MSISIKHKEMFPSEKALLAPVRGPCFARDCIKHPSPKHTRCIDYTQTDAAALLMTTSMVYRCETCVQLQLQDTVTFSDEDFVSEDDLLASSGESRSAVNLGW